MQNVEKMTPRSVHSATTYAEMAKNTEVKRSSSVNRKKKKACTPSPSHKENDDTDEAADVAQGKSCPLCKRHFSVFRPKHRCRVCSVKVCDECSRSKVKLTQGRNRGSRTCDPCARKHVSRMNAPSIDGKPSDSSEGGETTKPGEKLLVLEPSTKETASLLRMRHWISASILSVVLFLRVAFAGKTSSNAASHFFLLALQNIASVQGFTIGCGMLILIDELLRNSGSPSDLVEQEDEISKEPTVGREESDADEDGIPVDTGDHLPGDSAFSAEELVHHLKDCHKNLDEISLDSYIKVCKEITKLISCLGKGIGFAASTVDGYISAIHKQVALWPAPDQLEGHGGSGNFTAYSVQSCIDREASLGIADIGGKKNPSVSRCLLRLLWFIDFVESLIRCCLIECDKEDVSAGAIKAYEETIGSRHPWIIRKGVMAALNGTPSRSTFLLSLKVKNAEGAISEESANEILLQVHSLLVKLQAKVQDKFHTMNLTNIK